ncbi:MULTISPECIES: nitrogenase-stabilizing/protective protein NifW [unclassified Cupriavidus]|uniref:nitrogenase-stabilizing/protective protein NifW n=1 Tax=unclassified Cupriavidus TaxID=2640874 RepID=UPI001AE958B1|nr:MULTISPECIES: nitrogenase-stabilizing/protective protein NifW [unclassified Cupriavidus]MBP0633490.1 nitrogen fixation protein NifW [Cupriavidus sp. AcVe19-1a]MBP0639885.1 nitrogen fixation protein NifW [Cupriavidus sp. AcVe19-6a]
MQGHLNQQQHLSSTEDFFRHFDIAFDETVLNVSRLHILKRFFQYIEQQEEPPLDNGTALFEFYRSLLLKAYNDFVSSTPAEQRVFRCFREAEGRSYVSLDNLRASLGKRDTV